MVVGGWGHEMQLFNRYRNLVLQDAISEQCLLINELRNISWLQVYLRRGQWHPIPVLLPGESQGQGNLVGCCLWGHTESDTTEVT